MTQEQLKEIIKTIREVPDGNDDKALAVLQAAADSITLEKLVSLTNNKDSQLTEQSGVKSQEIKFSEEEIKKMPKTFRKEFRVQGCTAHVHKIRSGRKNWCYVIRYRRNGYNVNASSTDLEEAKRRFIQKLKEADANGGSPAPSVPSTFDGFATYYFENFYKRKVTPSTHRIALNQYKNHLCPHFKSTPLRKITPKQCQDLIDKIEAEGKGRTVDDICSLLNMIFKAAIKHNILVNNPMDMVFHAKHEREHGSALSKDEEKMLLESVKGTPQELSFAVALYTGMRPNEYETAVIDGEFIKARNSKRKNGKIEYKKIPITPMLRPYLDGVDELKFASVRIMRDRFGKLFPDRRLYDLRTTFYTRCQECNVAPVARDEFVGHSLGELGNTYTDLSDEFLLKEGQKLVY